MNDLEKLTRAAADITKALDGYTKARTNLVDAQHGQPGSGLGGGGGRGGGSPVETALGIAGPGEGNIRPDQARRQLAELDRIVRQLAKDAALLEVIVASQTPRAPTDKQRRQVDRANNAEPECRHCRDHANRYEPYRTVTDVDGILPAEVPLCRWHTDFIRRTGRPATKTETERHAQGRTIRLPV